MLGETPRTPARQPSERGLKYYRVRHAVEYTIWWAVVFVLVVVITLATSGRELLLPLGGGVIALLALILGWVVGVLPPFAVRYRRYEISEHAVFIQRGFLTRRRAIVPLERVQFVIVKRGPVERRFGLGTVVLQTAAGNEPISLLDDEVADELQERLSELARRSVHDI